MEKIQNSVYLIESNWEGNATHLNLTSLDGNTVKLNQRRSITPSLQNHRENVGLYYPSLLTSEAYSEPCQTSKTEFSPKIVDRFYCLTISTENSTCNVWLDSECASGHCLLLCITKFYSCRSTFMQRLKHYLIMYLKETLSVFVYADI